MGPSFLFASARVPRLVHDIFCSFSVFGLPTRLGLGVFTPFLSSDVLVITSVPRGLMCADDCFANVREIQGKIRKTKAAVKQAKRKDYYKVHMDRHCY